MNYKQTTKANYGIYLLSKNSNILSFDEARSASRSRSNKETSSYSRAAYQGRQGAHARHARRASDIYESSVQEGNSSRYSRSNARSSANSSPSTRSHRSADAFYANRTNQSGSQYQSRSGSYPRHASSRSQQKAMGNSSYEVRNSWDRQDDQEEFDSNVDREKTSVKDSLKKKFRSAKAEKQFNRTIGSSDDSPESGSRAALYEMRMGKNHRRTTEMQNEQKSSSRSKKVSRVPFLSSASRLTAGVVAIVVLFGALLYGPTADLYNETRKVQRLEAEYQALQEHNQALEAEVDYLKTDEGLENYAREQYGLIGVGEHQVIVENVTSSVDKTAVTNAGHTVLTSGVKTPDTWYSGVLDVIFQYEE